MQLQTYDALRQKADDTCDDAFIKMALRHVANGGSLIDISFSHKIRFCDINEIIHSRQDYYESYQKALACRKELQEETCLKELRNLSEENIAKIFKDDGSLMSPKDWPIEIAKCVQSVKMIENTDADGNTHRRFEVKFYDKLRAIELLGKSQGLFIDKHEIKADQTLTKLIEMSYGKAE